MTAIESIASPGRHRPPRGRGDAVRVDLWLSRIDTDRTADSDPCPRWLDDAERDRAGRFHFELDRARFVCRRSFLREVLAHYLEVEPQQVRLRTTAHGRPELAGDSDVRLNASHSAGLAVVAVTRGPSVGVDIERRRPIEGVLDLADGLFHEREAGWLRAMPDGDRSAAFLRLWTRKESFVKALGYGLSIPLDRFEVLSAGDDGAGRPVGPLGPLPCVFSDLDDLDGYVGAVTVAGGEARPRIELVERA